MIARVWHGWTTPANADAYQRLLTDTVFPGIVARNIPGFRGIEFFRRTQAGEVEFITIMRFDSLDQIRAFAGPDYEVAVVPAAAQALLLRFDARSTHYEVDPRTTPSARDPATK